MQSWQYMSVFSMITSFFFAILWIVSVCERKPRLKKELNYFKQLRSKILPKPRSDNLRTEKNMKQHFLEAATGGVLFLSLIHKTFQVKKTLKLCQKYSCHKRNKYINYFPHLNYSFWSWKELSSKVGKGLLVILTSKTLYEHFTIFCCCRACAKQIMSQTKWFEKLFWIYLITVRGFEILWVRSL